MKNDFEKIDAQNAESKLAQMTLIERIEMNADFFESEYAKELLQDQAIHELVFQAEQIATGNQPLP